MSSGTPLRAKAEYEDEVEDVEGENDWQGLEDIREPSPDHTRESSGSPIAKSWTAPAEVAVLARLH